jgi:hypothetical protein
MNGGNRYRQSCPLVKASGGNGGVGRHAAQVEPPREVVQLGSTPHE